jgi:hypothetical protein
VINKLGNIGLQGLERSRQGMARSAADIAKAVKPSDRTNMTRAIIELKQHENAAKANIKTLEVADKTLGSLLDVKA